MKKILFFLACVATLATACTEKDPFVLPGEEEQVTPKPEPEGPEEPGEDPNANVESTYVFDYQALGTSWLNATEKKLGDVEWYIDGMKNSGDYGNIGFSYFNNVGGSCYNKTAFGTGVTEVIVDHKSGDELIVYAGATQKPTTKVSPEVKGNIYTYVIPAESPYVTFKNGSEEYVNLNGISIKYKGSLKEDTTETPDPEVNPDVEGSGETKFAGWAELPDEQPEKSGDYYYAYHMRADADKIRNFTVCYSKDKMCPVWVASPMHPSYKGSSGRNDSYKDDPAIPVRENGRWDGYTRGHMRGSGDRTVSVATNKQVFYHSNIAPQLGYVNGGAFNSGGGVWNNLEDYTDGLWCSDTLYMVNGCYWENNNKRVDGTTIPTHYYKVMLRTKKGNSGKSVYNCTKDELMCVAFIVEHNTKQHMVKPHTGMMRSVDEIEKLTGHNFFANVPNAPTSSYKASDWGL